jgi:uncharacterized protein (TIGR01777 family)
VRGDPGAAPDQIPWDPEAGRLDGARLEGADAVIHLAGESIAAGRWTAARKARIRRSRVDSTRLLADTLGRLERKPGVLIVASAVGYYGNRGNEILVEDSAPGEGFLATLCRDWEAAADPAREHGIRVVHLRTGMVLSRTGGALAPLVPLFRAGLGGRLGSGRQFMSWIGLDDEADAIHHALTRDAVDGPVNLVSPQTVTNREFTATLGRVLGRPALLAVPAVVLRVALGELSGELLSSVRAYPAKLLASGYKFHYPDLEGALRHLQGGRSG